MEEQSIQIDPQGEENGRIIELSKKENPTSANSVVRSPKLAKDLDNQSKIDIM